MSAHHSDHTSDVITGLFLTCVIAGLLSVPLIIGHGSALSNNGDTRGMDYWWTLPLAILGWIAGAINLVYWIGPIFQSHHHGDSHEGKGHDDKHGGDASHH